MAVVVMLCGIGDCGVDDLQRRERGRHREREFFIRPLVAIELSILRDLKLFLRSTRDSIVLDEGFEV